MLFWHLQIFFKITFFKDFFEGIPRLDPDQASISRPHSEIKSICMLGYFCMLLVVDGEGE